MGYLSAKWDIYQPNIYQPNKIFINQMKYLSDKWEYLSAKLRGGWRPRPVASWQNNYIAKYADRRANIICYMRIEDKSPQLAA